MRTARVQPTARASRSCSTASAGPRVSTVAAPPVASAIWIGDLDRRTPRAGWSCSPTWRASTACCPRTAGPGPERLGHPLDADQDVGHVISLGSVRCRVEQRCRVGRADGDRVALLHVVDRQLGADDGLLGRQVGHQQVLAERRRRTGRCDVGAVAVAVDERLAVRREDRLAAEHVALRPVGRRVVVDGQRAQDGRGSSSRCLR